MNHEDFKDEMKTFRLKTHSWAGEPARESSELHLQKPVKG